VMSSVLGMWSLRKDRIDWCRKTPSKVQDIPQEQDTDFTRRLLGIFRSSSSRVRQLGKRAASMHGLKGEKDDIHSMK
jgi:hypothetical protein